MTQQQIKDTPQEMQNMGFDPTFQVAQIELLGHDSANSVLRRIQVDDSGNLKIDPTNLDTTYLKLIGGNLTGAVNITPATDVVPLTLKGGGAGTADLQQWYDKDAVLRSKLAASGAQTWYFGATASDIIFTTPGGYPGIILRYPSGTNLGTIGTKANMCYYSRTGEYGFQHFSGGVMTLGTGTASTPGTAQLHIVNNTGTARRVLLLIPQASQTGNIFECWNTSNQSLALIDINGAFVFNEQGADADSRVEGDTDVNLLYLDAGADRVGIGDSAPGEKFDVAGNINLTGVLKIDDVQVVNNRVIDDRIDDVINSGDATTDGVIDAIRDALITHGLIAAA